MNRKVLVTSLVICLLLSSCSNNQEVEETNEKLDKTLETSSILMATEGTYASDLTTYEIVVPEYVPLACDFDIDESTHTINALYDDGNFVIEYDFQYYDYGVTEVGIYSSSANTSETSRILELGEGWSIVGFDAGGYGHTYDGTTTERIECVMDSLSPIRCIHISENEYVQEVADSLDGIIDVFPYAESFEYNMAEYDNRTETDSYITMFSEDTGNELLLSSENNVIRYAIRENLAGLPVGVSEICTRSSKRLFGDNRGCIQGVYDDMWMNDCCYLDENLVVNIIYYNFGSYELTGDVAPVVSLAECVDNSIVELSDYDFSRVNVYGAELIYLPFVLGAASVFETGTDVIFVPVWALYFTGVQNSFSNPVGYLYSGTVYLNAFTGENLPRYQITG